MLFMEAPALSFNDKQVFLSMKKYEELADRAHALLREC
jgi:hypothetical protein